MAEETRGHPLAASVRFTTPDDDVERSDSRDTVGSNRKPAKADRDDICEEAQQELKNLTLSMKRSRLQCKRMENFAFDPMSLPPSRVPSRESGRSATPIQSQSGAASPRPGSAITTSVHSPPLTPAGSGPDRKGTHEDGPPRIFIRNGTANMTPEVSPPHEDPPTTVSPPQQGTRAGASPRSGITPGLTAAAQQRPRSMVEMSGIIGAHPSEHRSAMAGPAGDSLPPSRDGSPAHTPGAITPPGARSPFQRPFTPQGDPNDPYARGKRVPPNRDLSSIDPRFVFGARDRERRRGNSPSSTHSRSKDGTEASTREEKRRSHLAGGHHRDESVSSHLSEKKHGSMSDLKRFFKLGHKKHKDKDHHHKKPSSRSGSSSRAPSRPGTADRSSSHTSGFNTPFSDDMSLESKYGKFGKVLGSGAGGSVRIMKRQSDGVTFAVKQFRARHAYETEKEYSKKVTAEFCIGSTLHHGNIIETMDIIHEKGNWYEVMEYAPYDLFAIVMTGKMSREEITCSTLQILNGVTYLHNMGLAHRDLKLDNVVVNEHGILKIIDFGSAAVYRYPFETGVVLASGIVGSDPYLAPEVYDLPKYDPQPTDVWSLAIIFCCMTLRRFPWKQPRLSDNSYKLFVAEPDEESKRALSQLAIKAATENPNPYNPTERIAQSEPSSRVPSSEVSPGDSESQHRHHRSHLLPHYNPPQSEPNTNQPESEKPKATDASNPPSTQSGQQQPPVIKGRWRLLRLLPRETRHIISRMLEVDPARRATLAEIWEDRWVKTAFYGESTEADASGLLPSPATAVGGPFSLGYSGSGPTSGLPDSSSSGGAMAMGLNMSPQSRPGSPSLRPMQVHVARDGCRVCRQEEGGTIIRGLGHVHVLEPGSTTDDKGNYLEWVMKSCRSFTERLISGGNIPLRRARIDENRRSVAPTSSRGPNKPRQPGSSLRRCPKPLPRRSQARKTATGGPAAGDAGGDDGISADYEAPDVSLTDNEERELSNPAEAIASDELELTGVFTPRPQWIRYDPDPTAEQIESEHGSGQSEQNYEEMERAGELVASHHPQSSRFFIPRADWNLYDGTVESEGPRLGPVSFSDSEEQPVDTASGGPGASDGEEQMHFPVSDEVRTLNSFSSSPMPPSQTSNPEAEPQNSWVLVPRRSARLAARVDPPTDPTEPPDPPRRSRQRRPVSPDDPTELLDSLLHRFGHRRRQPRTLEDTLADLRQALAELRALRSAVIQAGSYADQSLPSPPRPHVEPIEPFRRGFREDLLTLGRRLRRRARLALDRGRERRQGGWRGQGRSGGAGIRGGSVGRGDRVWERRTMGRERMRPPERASSWPGTPQGQRRRARLAQNDYASDSAAGE